MKKLIAVPVALLLAAGGLAACSDADTASHNLSKDSDNFKILRRVALYNGITDKYIVTVEGYCALGNNDKADRVTVTCKVGRKDGGYVAPGQKKGYIKDIFTKSDNTLVLVDQLNPANVSKDHYKLVFKPENLVPDIEVR